MSGAPFSLYVPGLPLALRKPIAAQLRPLVDKVVGRPQGWHTRVGRLGARPG